MKTKGLADMFNRNWRYCGKKGINKPKKRAAVMAKMLILTSLLVISCIPVESAWAGRKEEAAFAAEAEELKTGWSNGKYFEEGRPARGWKKIGTNQYYFNKKGYPVTGIAKINKKYYYFTAKGKLLEQSKKINGTVYYINTYKRLEAYRSGSKYYRPSGSVMDDADALDYITLRRARKVVAKITTPSMSKAAKLKKCFDWVKDHGYHKRRQFVYKKGWAAVFANDHFLSNGGCCRSDGCAFAYLARALGYTDVYVCLDEKKKTAHCWAEINGRVYDPLFASRNYYKY